MRLTADNLRVEHVVANPLGIETAQPCFSKPHPVEGVDWVETKHRFLEGEASVRWERNKELRQLEFDMSLPAGKCAEVWLPVPKDASMFDSDTYGGADYVKMEAGCGRRRFISSVGGCREL